MTINICKSCAQDIIMSVISIITLYQSTSISYSVLTNVTHHKLHNMYRRHLSYKYKSSSNVFPTIGSFKCPVKKVKVLPYLLPSIGPGADPGVQAVSPQVTLSHPPGGRLPLLSTRPAVTFLAIQRHFPLASTKVYCLVTEAHACEQLAQGCYKETDQPRFKPATFWTTNERSTVTPHKPNVQCFTVIPQETVNYCNI